MKTALILIASLALSADPSAVAQGPIFEPVVLPALAGGVVDKHQPGSERPVANVLASGQILIGGETVFEPTAEGAKRALIEHLTKLTGKMGNVDVGKLRIASGRTLIRADVRAPFRSTQMLLEACGNSTVLLAKFDFAIRDPKLGPQLDANSMPLASAGLSQVLPYELPFDADVPVEEVLEDSANGERREPSNKRDAATLQSGKSDVEPVEGIEVLIRVVSPGTKLGVDHKPWTGTGPYTVTGRALSWSVGPKRMGDFDSLQKHLRTLIEQRPKGYLTIDARKGTTTGEALAIFAAARELGCKKIAFVGSYER